MFELFERTSAKCSQNITEAYSTSFSVGIKTLNKRMREPIYGIYGMVRYADEIVDTFHDYDKKWLLEKFKRDTFEAIELKISMNPILFSFQKTVNQYKIPVDLIDAFFTSMEKDLYETNYDRSDYEEYIYGSAEVVGLMCLKVFVEGDDDLYNRLNPYARALGAAFQKVNFLRDMKSDFKDLGRVYFPGTDFRNFREEVKRQIEKEIDRDFKDAYIGIMQLPAGAKTGVLLAYRYYLFLFHRICKLPVSKIKETRVRVPNFVKAYMLLETLAMQQFSV